MEGHGQCQLQFTLCQLVNPGHQAAGGQADVAHGNIHALGAVHQLQKTHDVVKIIQRLPNAHEHNVGNGLAGIHLSKQHLIQHFKGLQLPHQAADGGGAEGTAHAAAHLGGNAHGIAVVIAHQHRFHAVAVGQLPQIFDGAVLLGFLTAQHRGGMDGVFFRQRCPQRPGEIGHLLIGANTPVQPGIQLLCPEGRLPHFFELGAQLRQRHGF